MSFETTPKKSDIPALTREQLLEALDKDIETITADQSATGWNYWVILAALSALLWLALDAWEKGHFIVPNVLILTMAITITWDWLRKMALQLDSSPLAKTQISNRFLSLTGLLGSTRTNIVFVLLKQVFFLAVVFFLRSPFLLWLRIYYCLSIVIILLYLLVSYLDDFPEIPSEGINAAGWLQSTSLVLITVIPASAGILVWGIVWYYADVITTEDWRMGLVFSALIYLISLAIRNRVPTHFLNAYRIIRRNLAYGFIALEEARNQADILSIGGTLDQTLFPYLKRALNATERTETAFRRARQKVMDFASSVYEWASLPENPEAREKQIKSGQHQRELFDELDKASKLLNSTEAIWKKFKAKFNRLAPKSSGRLNSVENTFDQMMVRAKEIEASFTQTMELLELTDKVIKNWQDEKTLRERLTSLRVALNNFRN